MSGVKGMHARQSTSPDYAERVRARIKAGGIAKRLELYVLGKVEMSTGQVTAALGLLRKVVPDVSSVEHSGEIVHNYVANIPMVSGTVEEWTTENVPPMVQ